MSNQFGKLHYGQLSRDMLKIAINEKYTRLDMRLYAYLLLNANPFSGELYENPSVDEVSEVIEIKRRKIYYSLDRFKSDKVYFRAKHNSGIQGNLYHIHKVKQDRNLYEAMKSDPDLMASHQHPLANLFVGHLPRKFLEIDIETEDSFKRPDHLLFWWVCLNIDAEKYHLSRLLNIPDLAEVLGVSKWQPPRGFSKFQKHGLFEIQRPSYIQGTAVAISEADTLAAEAKAQRDYQLAENAYIKQERERSKVDYGRTLHKEEVKAMRKSFRQYFEETGEYMGVARTYRGENR